MKKLSIESCIYCGGRDTVKYTVFECPRTKNDRITIQNTIGLIQSTNNTVELALNSRTSWDNILGIVQRMIQKREDTRESKPNP